MVWSPLSLAASTLLLPLQLLEHGVEAAEVAFPVSAVALQPSVGFREGCCFEAARPPLGVASARDERGAFEHLAGLGDRRLADVDGGGKRRRGIVARCG